MDVRCSLSYLNQQNDGGKKCKKLSLLLTMIFLIAIPTFSSAQNWTKEELEVINYSKKCWDAWEQAILQRDRNIWLKTCNPVGGWSHWNVAENVLLTDESDSRTFDKWIKGIKSYYLGKPPAAIDQNPG